VLLHPVNMSVAEVARRIKVFLVRASVFMIFILAVLLAKHKTKTGEDTSH